MSPRDRLYVVVPCLWCTWFVPLPVCDHSQGVYFPPNTGAAVLFFGFDSNKQTNKQTDWWKNVLTGSFLFVNRLSLQSGTVCSGKLERIFASIEFSRIHAKETQKSFDHTRAKCCKLVQQRGKTRSSTSQALSFNRIFQQNRLWKWCTGKLSDGN